MACSEWDVPALPVKLWQMTRVEALTRMDKWAPGPGRTELWRRAAAAPPVGQLSAVPPLHRSQDLAGGVFEIVGADDVETAVLDDGFAFVDVGAFEANHQRHFEADALHRGDHAFGDDVAARDAAENVDEDALHLRIGEDDLEG